jgi:hypothetical protein
MAILPTAKQAAVTTRPRNQIFTWMKGFTMRQRISLVGAAVTLLLGLFLVWQGFETKSLSAMEKMAENIRKAKSYKSTSIVRCSYRINPKDPFILNSQNNILEYRWLATNSYRWETVWSQRLDGKAELTPSGNSVRICPAGKPGISIDRNHRTFCYLPTDKNPDIPGAMKVEDLGKLSGKSDRDLGSKEINGKTAFGFEIDVKKIAPEYPDKAIMEIWVDSESHLPIQTCEKIDPEDVLSDVRIITDYQWNIEIDPKLFDTTPPEDYTDTTPKLLSLEEQVQQITAAFKIYAEASGENYPKITTFYYGSPTDLRELLDAKMKYDQPQVKPLGSVGRTNPVHPTWDEINACQKKYNEAGKGFNCCSNLQFYNPGFAYYGQTITPKDKDKVLLRWKLDDGKYEVIFGDLRAETVTAERLHALEGK